MGQAKHKYDQRHNLAQHTTGVYMSCKPGLIFRPLVLIGLCRIHLFCMFCSVNIIAGEEKKNPLGNSKWQSKPTMTVSVTGLGPALKKPEVVVLYWHSLLRVTCPGKRLTQLVHGKRSLPRATCSCKRITYRVCAIALGPTQTLNGNSSLVGSVIAIPKDAAQSTHLYIELNLGSWSHTNQA